MGLAVVWQPDSEGSLSCTSLAISLLHHVIHHGHSEQEAIAMRMKGTITMFSIYPFLQATGLLWLHSVSFPSLVTLESVAQTQPDGEVAYKVSINSMENRKPDRGKHVHLEERQWELNCLSIAENSDRIEQGHKSASRQGFTGPRTPGNIPCFFSVKYTGSFTCVVTLG